MLVLTRHAGEGLRIGKGVFVYIRAVKGGAVSVAIDAPKHVRIVRLEIDNQQQGKDRQQ